MQKSVDKRKQVWYYKQAVARKQISTECKKVFEKNLKKLLTNTNECDIINESLNERTVTRILKIKQRKEDNYTRNYFEKLYFLNITK